MFANRSLLATRRLITSLSSVASAARLSRYPSSLSKVLKGIVALLDRTVVPVSWNAAVALALPKDPPLDREAH